MNKKLLTLAIGAAMVAAPFAAVQADHSNAEIFGKVHYSYDFVNDDTVAGDTTDDADDVTGMNRATRFGIKGGEDLGNGMKAIYFMDLQLSGAAAGSPVERQSYVGLSGDFGTVTIGNQYMPYKLATSGLDIFVDTIADHNEIISNAYDNAYNPESQANAVVYKSPSINGIQASIGRASANTADVSGDVESETLSLNGTYTGGPLYVAIGYEQVDVPNNATGVEITGIKLGAGYQMDAFTVGFEWENRSIDTNGVESSDRDGWLINGTYTMGAEKFMATYGDMDNSGTTGAATNDSGSMWALGVNHAMSKRTGVYAIYAATSNDGTTGNGGQVDLNNYASRGAGLDVTTLSLGVTHTF